MIRFFIFVIFFSVHFAAAQPVIEKIEPPNWWTGMKLNSIQLMSYGTDLTDISVNFEPAGIRVISVEEAENDSYAFINIEIPADLPPADYKMVIQKNGDTVRKDSPLSRT
jgi:neopullulanase